MRIQRQVFVFGMNLLSDCTCLRVLIPGFPLQVIYSQIPALQAVQCGG